MEVDQLSEYEIVLHRILEAERVQGYVIIDEQGLQANEKIENTTALQYAHLYREISNMAQSLARDINPNNELVFLRVQTKKNEVLAAIADEEIFLVIQKAPGLDFFDQ